MRKFENVYTDKINESKELNEARIVSEYETILEALMVDNNVINFSDLDESNRLSFENKVSECFDSNIGMTERGKEYMKNRKPFLTESSTIEERKGYLKNNICKVVESKMYTISLKEGIYAAINDVYENVNAKKLSDALSVEEIEQCICECVTEHIKNTIIKDFKNEIITD